MIVYHPYKDANHCAYRIISILSACNIPVNVNYLHIADFYYLFPSQLKNIEKLVRSNSVAYNDLQLIEDSYENMENSRKVFFELKSIRNNVLYSLVSKGLVEFTTKEFFIKINYKKLPISLVNEMEKDSFRKSKAFEIITTKMKDLKLYGESGLKSKSGLMEYKYDI
ncbi:ABC-three component system middle component 5 [Photobacterium angustum]|uniref:Uncharacterized protein n=1 Tax=Photobacterium angustum TaxID=661 RepID=A0A855SF53_PHOAN|nr:ABC-three component system middle component 5 [Photobacterium angustum]KJF83402.1 hypothetical protein UB36_02230 [Photobacterium damselae subsp. damselae]KJG42741.1 hypothetical protein UA35_01820 [Photobacterium angustum]KJG47710.1 hypothetical protein UA31_02230 [Photobacterium angustum]KJG50039.1 hypothetical protein UA30_05950 [Photobacterium angustum]KJG53871.1 hypothetical protein UA34_06195 [Photobacterium angustum]